MSKRSILLVDDHADAIEPIRAYLIKKGYNVSTAANGHQALATANDHDFDLVVLDVHMPGMNGFEVCRALRRSERNHTTPIIFLTADGNETSEIDGLDAGGNEYLQKPVSAVVIERRIAAKLRETARLDKLRQSVNKWRERASIDSLTGAQTRRCLDELTVHGGIIMVDIDHFKNYNDDYGHSEGDECLRRVARVLIDKAETVVRMGGEEFMVLVPGGSALSVAVELCNDVRRIQNPSGKPVTISIGAVRVDDDSNLADAIRIADALLYQSKHGGRDRVTYGLSSNGEPNSHDACGSVVLGHINRRRFRN